MAADLVQEGVCKEKLEDMEIDPIWDGRGSHHVINALRAVSINLRTYYHWGRTGVACLGIDVDRLSTGVENTAPFSARMIRARQRPEARADKAETAKQKRPCRHRRRNQIQKTELDPVPFDESGNQHDPASANLLSALYPAHAQAPSNGPCEKCKKEKRDARVYRSKLIAGLVFPYFLASVDLTIVASSIPFIASHFTGPTQLDRQSLTLTSAAFIPAFGQLADVYGRHFVLQLAMFLMLVGNVFCAAAQTWGMLLFGRALQGTSSVGIMID
ncbi:hypothetical protein ACJ73_05785 [Blastomyces percursus]|uniref:Major facilitator superfamily (MFS) profile domain-containing protein n=1 Tax=Blastomyces percursus TaxID=1658174 RepID=A0A1J9Q2U5_9EURO|nr:hypothetical protein ACJ73_05785 [Blastomyces percursus]